MSRKFNASPFLGLAAVALGCAALSASAQVATPIPPELIAPTSAYNTSSTNWVIRIHQIGTNRPAPENAIENVQLQLLGEFGPSIATPGPNSDGSYSSRIIDYDTNDLLGGPSDTISNPGFYNNLFPGIVGTTNIALEAIGYVYFPAGTNVLGVRCNDSFRLTIGNADNPRDAFALQPAGAVRSPGGATADTLFSISIATAGVYPVRLVYGQGQGSGNVELYYSNQVAMVPYLLSDPFDGDTWALPRPVVYAPASLPIVPPKAYVSYLQPTPEQAGLDPLANILVQLVDAGTTVNTNTIALSLNGSPLAPDISQAGGVTTLASQPNSPLLPGANTATLVFQDSAANTISNSWTFSVLDYLVIPPSWAYAVGSQDNSKPGFNGKVALPRSDANLSGTIGIGNAQIAGTLIDPVTGVPYVNLAATTTNGLTPNVNWFGYLLAQPGGSFAETGVIDYAVNGSGGPVASFGNFATNNIYPGMPAANDTTYTTWANSGSFAVEIYGFIHLTPGLHVIGVHCDDAFQLAAHPNDARDIFRRPVAFYDSNRGGANTPSYVLAQTEGLYSFRLVQQNYQNSADSGLELWTAPATAPAQRTLVNSDTGFKCYRDLTVPSRPYVKQVSPGAGSSGVEPRPTIRVVLVNLDSTVPVLKVNGQTVSHTSSTVGNETTISYTPAESFSNGELVQCEVEYVGLTGAWSFVTATGRKALFVTGGGVLNQSDGAFAQRLSTVFGYDVVVTADGPVTTTNNADGMDLIVISSTINGGQFAGTFPANDFKVLPIPIINWESAWCDELAIHGGGAGNQNFTTFNVVGEGHPAAGGLTNGTYTFISSTVNAHCRVPAPDAINIANRPDNAQSAAYVLTNGTTVGTFTHPAKRAFLGFIGNDGFTKLNENGMAIVDATLNWLVRPRLQISLAGAGSLLLSWQGSGQLQETTSLVNPSWSPSPNQNNPQSITPGSPQKYYRVLEQ